jgi:hypothetical protein
MGDVRPSCRLPGHPVRHGGHGRPRCERRVCARLASNRSAALAPFVDQAEIHARKLEYFRARISVALQRAVAQQVKA